MLQQAREKLKSDPSFEAITEEVERVRIFKDYLKTIKVRTYTCSYVCTYERIIHTYVYTLNVFPLSLPNQPLEQEHKHKSHKKKKKYKRSSRSRSRSPSVSVV